MFDGRSDPVPALDASCKGCRHFSADKRILRIIFEVASAERIAVDVHARCKPEGHAELLQLCADHAAYFLEKLCVECLRQKRSDRDRTAVLIIIFSVGVEEFGSKNTVLETLIHVHFVNTAVRRIFLIMGGDADACRPVSQNDIGNTVFFQQGGGCLPGCTRYGNGSGSDDFFASAAAAADKSRFFFRCQLLSEFGGFFHCPAPSFFPFRLFCSTFAVSGVLFRFCCFCFKFTAVGIAFLCFCCICFSEFQNFIHFFGTLSIVDQTFFVQEQQRDFCFLFFPHLLPFCSPALLFFLFRLNFL